MNTLKNQILKLRIEGKSYRAIEKELQCSRSVISYHLNSSVKEKAFKSQKRNRTSIRTKFKEILGGKCNICNYNKCLSALEFHHLDPSLKDFEITDAIWGKVKVSKEKIEEEVKKCILLCANCHRELHESQE